MVKHEVRVVTSFSKKDDVTKVIASLIIGKGKDVRIAIAFSKENVGAKEGELSVAGVKAFVMDWKKYARKHDFIFRDETNVGMPWRVK